MKKEHHEVSTLWKYPFSFEPTRCCHTHLLGYEIDTAGLQVNIWAKAPVVAVEKLVESVPCAWGCSMEIV